ncbi:MAG: hypothetical protein OHK93_001615 [Ramalina farinacea]|uniref:Heterokaryon incompatibility domain-containing protein n=1 Tax=Ramalina farinacea TaxID=258253 RepID=A0AA43TZN4_9LECA|nr:hypothetical protein [Ramalina farinacea]
MDGIQIRRIYSVSNDPKPHTSKRAPPMYNALPDHRHIRLLSYKYLPDENEIKIQCNLITKSLDEITSSDLKYWALSYVWGDPDDTVAIACDGKDFSITRNLHALLINLFKTNEMEKPRSGYIWADAICINQGDDEEKTLQVRLMQDIFSHADHVVAWLGEESESIESGFTFLRPFFATRRKYKLVDFETQEEYLDDGSVDVNSAEAVRLGIPGRTDKVWADVGILLSNPWFSRVWVVQEALMAETLTFLCGTTTLPAEMLMPFADSKSEVGMFMDRMPLRSLAPWWVNASYLGILKRKLDRGDTLRMLDILVFTQGFEASDARDKVFAMVGLAADIDNTFIDYSQQDPRPMLVPLAKHLLGDPDEGGASCPSMKPLGYAGEAKTMTDLPSWVANWTSPDDYMTPYWTMFDENNDDHPTSTEKKCTDQFAQVTNDDVNDMMFH